MTCAPSPTYRLDRFDLLGSSRASALPATVRFVAAASGTRRRLILVVRDPVTGSRPAFAIASDRRAAPIVEVDFDFYIETLVRFPWRVDTGRDSG